MAIIKKVNQVCVQHVLYLLLQKLNLSALLTLHGGGPRPPEPRDFRFRESSSVARQSYRVAFMDRDVRTGQVVNDLRRN